MKTFKALLIGAAAAVLFAITATVLTFLGYEIDRDSPFEVACKEANGQYFRAKGNEEFCIDKDIFFDPMP